MSNFHTVAIDAITINREERQRREIDPDKITELAESIHKHGLLHPPVVTRELVLIAGERRVLACKALGWTQIDIHFHDQLDPIEQRLVELDENVKRVDLDWKDQCRAVDEYHELKKSQNGPDWSVSATAKELGGSNTDIHYKIKIAQELKKGNERVENAPKLSVARGIIERGDSRKAASAVEIKELESVIGPIERPQVIFNEDFHKWAERYGGPKFNFVHCDFPYGINADDFNQSGAAAHGGYADTPETYFNLIEALHVNFERICAPSCHIMFWFSMKFYRETLDIFDTKGIFKLDRFPLIWFRSDNAGILPDPKRGPRRVYETCLYGSAGDRQVVRSVANTFPCETVRERHMSEKPQRMLRHFMQMFVDENTLILDPTCGSGSSLRAARDLNAAHLVGLEINPEYAKIAQDEYNATAI